jgi:hypothetical protein
MTAFWAVPKRSSWSVLFGVALDALAVMVTWTSPEAIRAVETPTGGRGAQVILPPGTGVGVGVMLSPGMGVGVGVVFPGDEAAVVRVKSPELPWLPAASRLWMRTW